MSQVPRVDKRRYLRYEILDYVLIREAEQGPRPQTLKEDKEPIKAVVVDIGLGGLQVRTREKLREGQSYWVEVGRPGLEPLILRCEVRHVGKVPDSDLFSTGMGFIPENHVDRMAIATYVHQVFQRQCDLLA